MLSNTVVVILKYNQSDYEWHIRTCRQVMGVCNLVLILGYCAQIMISSLKLNF